MWFEDSIINFARATLMLQFEKLTTYEKSYHAYCKEHLIHMGKQLNSVVR